MLPHKEEQRWLLGHLFAENQAQCTWDGTNRVGGPVHEQHLQESPRAGVGVRGDSTEGLREAWQVDCLKPNTAGLLSVPKSSISCVVVFALSLFESRVLMLAAAAAKLLQSCPTLCDPIDSSPLGSTIPGILQARTLEWVAISFSNA